MHAGPDEIAREYVDKMLLAALREAQSVVRSYDTKAQIVGVGYILALNLILHFGDLLPTHAPLGPLFFAVVWGVVILPIVQFGDVLYPSRTHKQALIGHGDLTREVPFAGRGRSHSSSFDQRRRPETLRTAMATAFF